MTSSDDAIIVKRLRRYSAKAAAGIGALLPYLYPGHPGTPVSEQLLKAIVHSPTSDELLAFRGTQIVGKATVNLIVTELYSKAHLDNFIAHPDVRGQGVGLAIWEELILWAKEKEAAKITLVSDRPEAIEFYLHRGAAKSFNAYFTLLLEQ